MIYVDANIPQNGVKLKLVLGKPVEEKNKHAKSLKDLMVTCIFFYKYSGSKKALIMRHLALAKEQRSFSCLPN